MMENLVVLIAEKLPEDAILDEITKSIQAYKIDRSQINANILAGWCGALLTKQVLKNKSASELLKDFEMYERTNSLLTPNKQ